MEGEIMALEQQAVEHTGAERYEMTLVFPPEDLRVIERMTTVGEIIPDTIVLVWTRRIGEDWQRYTRGQHGSRAVGHEKLLYSHNYRAGVRRSHEIFTPDLGEIKRWAEYLPGLRNSIEGVEAMLPRPLRVGLTR